MRENAMTGIIFSNMHDERLGALTSGRTFASVPFGGRYRLVDFTLSNMSNFGMEQIGIITKHNYRSLVNHIGSGRAWDMNRKHGGIRVISPYGRVEHGVYHDRLEALYGARDFLSAQSAKYVMLSDCNTVSNLDISDMLSQHIKNGADITMAYKRMPLREDERQSACTLILDDDGFMRNYFHNPAGNAEYDVDLKIWIMEKGLLEKLIDDGQSKGYTSFSRQVLRDHFDRLNIFGYEAKGFVYKIMSFEGYYKANMALLSGGLNELFCEKRPVCTKVYDDSPVIYGKNSEVTDSLVADGCEIYGKVKRSIIFRNVIVEEGAEITDSIIMPNSCICTGASLYSVVTDKDVTVRGGRMLSGDNDYPLYIKKGRTV